MLLAELLRVQGTRKPVRQPTRTANRRKQLVKGAGRDQGNSRTSNQIRFRKYLSKITNCQQFGFVFFGSKMLIGMIFYV